MSDLTEQWVNIYKSKKHGNYWTGAFCYKTKEEAVKDLADKEHYLTTVNIEDMLQKTENVAKNVANEKLQDLTKQWKKGELPEGHYYIKTRSETNIDEYIQWYKDHGIPSEKSFAYFNVQQVLAPVPSYEEYEQLENWNRFTADYHELREKLEIAEYENVELKDLLKECFEYIDWTDGTGSPISQQKLLDKINEALK